MDNERQTYDNARIDTVPNIEQDFMEETAGEIAEPIRFSDREVEREENGRGIGWLALALSIVSLFLMPVIMGAAGIIFGFIARRRGAETLGAWAIGIGAVSIILSFFVRFW
ncbi:DUF4190 domain-containing protein [Anoxybacillus sp. LAT_35]|uniref:DUF4190 domain-containing protein n=1 Tax=Anoxybacillus TaxID=150247 RepID=UPI001EDA2B89|nr:MULTISPECIES: DUF4190 domain-containing protein [Anoxybacillus]MCG5024257.1 DUF4190 domain-containing protein [Anoxybacillus flavithermus]MCG6198273.1 DUF4190 domain-containing protein [Anoxybacillus sp. LAT_38]MCG3085791.1 DUF4190 domain-containing protein [Anoxybacillus sp. LAT27]MCG6171885.1 DUF4190 domain-containing protein [Anoxybacillus sp. LAT_11]MCG6174315.1 DUF4190 domain-containing protein [Anoxybacillus sp. LAT_31]